MKNLKKLYKEAKKAMNNYLNNGGSFAYAEATYNEYITAVKKHRISR